MQFCRYIFEVASFVLFLWRIFSREQKNKAAFQCHSKSFLPFCICSFTLGRKHVCRQTTGVVVNLLHSNTSILKVSSLRYYVSVCCVCEWSSAVGTLGFRVCFWTWVFVHGERFTDSQTCQPCWDFQGQTRVVFMTAAHFKYMLVRGGDFPLLKYIWCHYDKRSSSSSSLFLICVFWDHETFWCWTWWCNTFRRMVSFLDPYLEPFRAQKWKKY